jgi:Flp pilus assembly protein TadB
MIMRTRLSQDRSHPLRFNSAVSAYAALIALVIVVFTSSGAVATIAAILVGALLVGSYLLERWARRRLLYEREKEDVPAAS